MATTKTTKTAAPKAAKTPKATDGSFSVIFTGGKQFIVSKGDLLKIEILTDKEYKEGDAIVFDKVLLTDTGSETTVGAPYIAGASVGAKIVKIGRYPTVDVVKYKQKSRYYKKYGHRQPYFEVEITR